MILSGIYFILAMWLFWGNVCRLMATNVNTRIEARLAFAALGAAAVWSGVSALLWHPQSPADLGLLAAMCAVQLVSSRLWATGVPRVYDTAPSQLDSEAA